MEDIDDRSALKRERRKHLEALRKRAKSRLDDDAYEEALGMAMTYVTNAERELDRIDDEIPDSAVRQILGVVDGWERQVLALVGHDD